MALPGERSALYSFPNQIARHFEEELSKTNREIHYTGQYFANKPVYAEFCKSREKGKFRREHSAEISLYESARKFLEEQSSDGKLPSMKLLKEKKAGLLEQKKTDQMRYHHCRDRQKELDAVCSNVDMILGKSHSRQAGKEKERTIS